MEAEAGPKMSVLYKNKKLRSQIPGCW